VTAQLSFNKTKMLEPLRNTHWRNYKTVMVDIYKWDLADIHINQN